MKELRVGVIGIGARSRLATLVEKSPVPARLVAGVDPLPAAQERANRLLGANVPVLDSLSELLELGVDAAFVTSPDDTHADLTCELLDAGVAVYLEKPLAITTSDADRVLEAAYRSGTKLYVGHNMRHMAVVTLMRDLINEGKIGEVKAIWCRHFVGNGGDYYFRDWHAERERGTGLLLQKGAHDIDVMHWLAGSQTREVVAMGDLMVYDQVQERQDNSNGLMSDWFDLAHWPPEELSGLNPVIDVEDISMMLMRMDSGVLASYQQCHFTPDYWRNYTVIGTKGRLENFGDGEGGQVKLWNRRHHYHPEGDEVYDIVGDAGGHDDADQLTVNEFLEFITTGAPTDTSAVGARDAVVTAICATESLRSGSAPVGIPPVPETLVNYFRNSQKPSSDEPQG